MNGRIFAMYRHFSMYNSGYHHHILCEIFHRNKMVFIMYFSVVMNKELDCLLVKCLLSMLLSSLDSYRLKFFGNHASFSQICGVIQICFTVQHYIWFGTVALCSHTR